MFSPVQSASRTAATAPRTSPAAAVQPARRTSRRWPTMPVTVPPSTAIRQNQASARMNALLSGLTSWASPGPTSCSSARGATAAQMSPAATPSTALPARAAANAASRPFVGTPSDRFDRPARSYPSALLRLDGVYLGQDRRDRVEGGLVPGPAGRDQRVVDAGRRQFAQVGEERGRTRLRVLAEVEAGGDGLLDRGEVAAGLRAVLAEHVQLVLEVVTEVRILHVEQVAGVGVLCDQAQRLALPAAADQDRRVRSLQGGRGGERTDQLVVPALVGALVTALHLVRDLQQFLQPLEALGQRGERDAETFGLEGGARAGTWVRLDVPRRTRPD